MKNTFRAISVILVIVVLIATLAQPKSSVQACGQSCETPTPTAVVDYPKCGFEVSAESGTAPLLVTALNTSGTTGAIFWDFGDGTFGTGQQVGHTYGVGTFKLQQLIKNDKDIMCWQSKTITVRESVSTPVASSTSIVVPVPNNSSNNSTNITTGGDNSPAIVGDGNVINITINPTPAPTTTEPTKENLNANLGNQNQSSNNNNITVQPGNSSQPTTQKVGKVWAIFHAMFKSLETFFRYLDEGLFPVVVIK